jgi:medium-chain acyl-[acyl-carrier-protein] hydrolase
MSDLSTRLATLPPEKQAALLQRLKQKIGPSAPERPTLQTSSDGWIIRYRPREQASLRLFCFSYAGGGASVFRSWADLLPEEVEVCCIQLPGHEYRLGEPAYTRLAPLVQTLAEAIAPYLDRPFAFYGHSMGALVSFELARQLRRAHNKQPVRLCLAAYRAPQLPNPNIKIYHLPSEVFKVVLRADGIPESILQSEELMQAMLPTLRADFELCDTYRYAEEPPLECPFSIFGGLEDVRVGAADLDAWRLHSCASSNLHMLPGSHFFLHSAPELLLAAIAQDLGIQPGSAVPVLAAQGKDQARLAKHS